MDDNGRELGAFLRARRARVAPESVGIAGGRRRRVRGLRREELAQLAGISVDYYVRLEQGRSTQPSAPVLDALAGALGLGPTERRHLVALAAGPGGDAAGARTPARVGTGVRRMLDGMPGLPAVVMDYRLDVLAWNALGSELFGGLDRHLAGDPNHAAFLFGHPDAAVLFPDREQRARESVAVLRHAAGRWPGDPYLDRLVTRLTDRSAEFRRLWAAGEVLLCGSGSKRFRHPVAGELVLDYETLHIPVTEGELAQQLYVYSAAEGSAAAETLRRLAAAPERAGAQP